MTKQRLQKYIINRKICICKNKLKQKINFGHLPLINNYKTKKNFKKKKTYRKNVQQKRIAKKQYNINAC